MMKVACYAATRNYYLNVMPSLKSLLKNGNIDRVYILAEDDDIGVDLPAKVIVKNVSRWRDELLDKEGPNYNCKWSYMVMLKVVLCKIFPKHSRILWLDCDTIVRGDLSPLWDLDLEGLYFAGAREPYWTEKYQRSYVNAGVLMFNLEKMRWIADKLIWVMNNQKFTFVEQDCLNYCCAGEFRIMDAAYNAGDWTEKTHGEIVIRHFMASKGMWKTEPEVRAYANMEWEEVFRDGNRMQADGKP